MMLPAREFIMLWRMRHLRLAATPPTSLGMLIAAASTCSHLII